MNAHLPDHDELLQRYLDGELSKEEGARLESRLREDEALARQLEDKRAAVEAIRLWGLKEIVRSVHAGMMEELRPATQKAPVVPLRRKVAMAVAVAAALILVFAGIRYFSAPSAEEIFRETYVAYIPSATRGAEERETPLEELYRQQRYTEVVALARGSKTLNPEQQLLAGVAALEAGEPAAAVSWLEGLAAQEKGFFQQDAEFYLSLAYLRQGNYKVAYQLAAKMARGPHVYGKQYSEEALEDLSKLAGNEK